VRAASVGLPALPALLALLAALAAACAPKPTEILVLVGSTSLASPGYVDQISAKVMDGRGVLRSSHDFTVAGWPMSFGVRPADNHAAPVIIEVTGAKQGAPIVTRRVETMFVEGSTRLLTIDLELACVPPPTCPNGQTCIHGSCAPDTVGNLPDVPPGTGAPWDASIRVAQDAGASADAAVGEADAEPGTDAIPGFDDALPAPDGMEPAPDAADGGTDAVPSDVGDAAPADSGADGGLAALTVKLGGDGSGYVVVTAGITNSDCMAQSCTYSFPPGTTVSLFAEIDSFSTFIGFSPTLGTGMNPMTFVLDRSVSVSATFGLQNPQQPPVVSYHTAIYAPSTNRMIVFGGINGAGGMETSIFVFPHPDVRPSAVGELLVASPPPGRTRHTAVYGPVGKQMIVFGGQGTAGPMDDIWVLDNADGMGAPLWHTPGPLPNGPGPISGHVAAYNDGISRMLVVDPMGAVWYLSNPTGAATWSRIVAQGNAPAVSGASSYYDATRDVFYMYGGIDAHTGMATDLLYQLSNALSGSPMWTTALQTSGSPPDPSNLSTLVYHAPTNSLFTWGGLISMTTAVGTPLMSVGPLNGTLAWAPVSTSSPAPGNRFGATAILLGDAGLGTLVLYGGFLGGGVPTNELDILDLTMMPAMWRP
jgi:hypothetical protein